MIPKIIHWCWVGPDSPPPFIKRCVKSWKKHMPDYEIRLWDRDSFDMNSVPFVKEAFEAKKWAFVADYIRLHALYNYGGIYLDSDVMIFKSLDPFLNYKFFTGQDIYQPNVVMGPEAAIMGSLPKHPFIKEAIEYYKSIRFRDNEGNLNQTVIPQILGNLLVRYGYEFKDTNQELEEDINIFSTEYFCNKISKFYRDKNYAFHINANSWCFTNRGMFFHFCWKYKILFFYRLIEKLNLWFLK